MNKSRPERKDVRSSWAAGLTPHHVPGKERRATGGGGTLRAAAAVPPTDRRRKDGSACSVEMSGNQSNVHTVRPLKPTVRRAVSAPKSKKTDIPKRQMSQEAVMTKSSAENPDVDSKELPLCPESTFAADSETNTLDMYDGYYEDFQYDRPDDEPMEQLSQVDTIYGSNEVGNENTSFETEEQMKNNTTAEIEFVDESIPHIHEISDATLSDERESNGNIMSSLESESIALIEKPGESVVVALLENNDKYRERQTPTLNDAMPVLDQESIESTKSLRDRFEALHTNRPDDRPTPKSNKTMKRFENQVTIKCELCEKKVYHLEKIEIESRVYHKTCFKCSYCQCLLRMDSFTRNCNRLYCMPHFKQLFKIKGNYDQGFDNNNERNSGDEK